jgi:hypothetical protein
MPKLQWPI